MSAGWEYTLTDFGDFLEMRRVAFAEPMPATRLCGVCGLLPSRTSQLPCGHVFCESCYSQVPQGKDRCCLFDGKKFTDSNVHSVSVELCELEQRRIVCAAGSRVCGFSGKLSELADHLTRCGSGETKCGKCQRTVFRSIAVDHYRACAGPLRAPKAEVDAKGIGGAPNMVDVDRSTRELMLCKCADLKAMFSCFTNALAEKVANLERLDYLNEDQEELTKLSDTHSQGGYTFEIECEFSKEENNVYVAFILFLCDGERDSCVEWPFKKRVTLIVVHPRNHSKDIRLQLHMDRHDAVKKPSAGTWNMGCFTDDIDWKDIALHGYVDRNALYLNVELE
ncbi:uncharacterized protein LOC142772218 [Rhipicephalus microplus]|uniref:uncharacterized protein LOC142772218 n=1 Tax=Rhipicephalus microplus TaxID=6941 RepID=UPI003F6CD2BE